MALDPNHTHHPSCYTGRISLFQMLPTAPEYGAPIPLRKCKAAALPQLLARIMGSWAAKEQLSAAEILTTSPSRLAESLH